MAYCSYRDLRIWQNAITLASKIYSITENYFPNNEKYGLSSQIQRAVVSISSNIAERHGRSSDKEFDRYLRISIGSACEVDSQVEIAYRLGYIDNTLRIELSKEIEALLKMIYTFRKTVQVRIEKKNQADSGNLIF